MSSNLERAGDMAMAESLMAALTLKGMGRQDAHETVRRMAREATGPEWSLLAAALKNQDIISLLGEEGVRSALDPAPYIRAAARRTERFM